ncbi:MAG: nitrite/sulfite reductase [Nitrosopumilus sp.]|nr:nitrite/sulfite reductase [Nitrosopumilus sp.]CAI9831489.1 putative ferredoxin-dependent sulfite reductase [Nitrosopumilaceae archaeon]MDA7944608.1 nitrite/sulfite reductase [Nitrosopumilus sp.]MDA7952229.1 nitrite/sulfite reductase [Nitrosopumilus sp.]MDA7953887.1 nitrite/sulfite reductase [Nitrosopumilus sp.]
MDAELERRAEGGAPDWARHEEADEFARTVRLFRAGRYDADSFRRFRLQNGAYGTRMTGDYAMVRIKLPAGEVRPEQLERIARLSEQYSIGSAHFSTRENVQLHWVVLEDVSEVMRGLAGVGLTSREACGNTVRNVMCSPLSGVCPEEAFDSTPYALATARFFLRNPMSQNLPRKFKFNFTCCEEHGMARIVDVGLVPRIEDGVRGFRVYLGGGLGNKSYVGHLLEEFTPEEDLLHTSIAVMRIFDRLGDRKNMARNRMRYLVHDMGWEKFQALVLKERAVVKATQSVVTSLQVDARPAEVRRPVSVTSGADPEPAGYQRWLSTCTVRQRQPGYRAVFVSLEAGDITSGQLRSLAGLVRDHSGEGHARAGFLQDVVLRHVHEDDLPRLYAGLVSAGLARPGALTMASPVGCSGTTSCNLALTNSHRLAKEIQKKFLEMGLDGHDDLRGSTIKISGCPNSCGQHGIATIGFYGGGARVGKDMYANYQMSLGGRSDGGAALGATCARVPAKRVMPVILRIIEIFREHKSEGDTLGGWLHRLAAGAGAPGMESVSDVKRAIEPLLAPPSKEEDPDFYLDYGSDTGYHTKTGRGECAA